MNEFIVSQPSKFSLLIKINNQLKQQKKNLFFPCFSYSWKLKKLKGQRERSSAKQNKSCARLYSFYTDIHSLRFLQRAMSSSPLFFLYVLSQQSWCLDFAEVCRKERLRCKGWIGMGGEGWVGGGVVLPNIKCSQINMPHMSGISIHQIKQPKTPERLCIQADVQFQP